MISVSMISTVQGNAESFDGRFLRGWASDGSHEPLRLRVVANGVIVEEVIAGERRDDVIAAGLAKIGSGFSTLIPAHLFVIEDCEVDLFDCRTGDRIPGTPYRIPARPMVEVAAASADFSLISDVIVTARAGTGAAARTSKIRSIPSCATPTMSAARR
jgi:hypothetical protein